MRPHPKIVAILAAALCAACGEGPRSIPAPLDRFTFPTGLALVPVEGGARRALVVVSSNFDLRYASADGGSVIAIDPDVPGDALSVLGAVRIGSFGGELGLVSATPTPGAAGGAATDATCPGFPGVSFTNADKVTTVVAQQQLLVPSRSRDVLYRIDLAAAGTSNLLSCGERCEVGLSSSLGDPYGVQVACRDAGASAGVYVSHLRAPNNNGWLSKLDLADAASAPSLVSLGSSPPSTFAWDASRARLYVTGRFGVIDLAALRWIDPLFSETLVHAQNFGLNATTNDVRGSELRSMALSSDGKRGYIAMRLFDRDVVTSIGIRPTDLAGALAVVDLTETPAGFPAATLLKLVPVGVGPNQVAVLPRPVVNGVRRGDVVAVSNTDEGTVVLYDDETGAIATVLGTAQSVLKNDPFSDAAVNPGLKTKKRPFGAQPFGLVSESSGPTTRRLYVGSFDRGFITAVDVDLNAPSNVTFVGRYGREVPQP